jgi:hypothetical protein
MKIGCGFVVALQSGVWVAPDAEEAQATPDLLVPLTVGVRLERKRGVWRARPCTKVDAMTTAFELARLGPNGTLAPAAVVVKVVVTGRVRVDTTPKYIQNIELRP